MKSHAKLQKEDIHCKSKWITKIHVFIGTNLHGERLIDNPKGLARWLNSEDGQEYARKNNLLHLLKKTEINDPSDSSIDEPRHPSSYHTSMAFRRSSLGSN